MLSKFVPTTDNVNTELISHVKRVFVPGLALPISVSTLYTSHAALVRCYIHPDMAPFKTLGKSHTKVRFCHTEKSFLGGQL
jgi:hypothetical protein